MNRKNDVHHTVWCCGMLWWVGHVELDTAQSASRGNTFGGTVCRVTVLHPLGWVDGRLSTASMTPLPACLLEDLHRCWENSVRVLSLAVMVWGGGGLSVGCLVPPPADQSMWLAGTVINMSTIEDWALNILPGSAIGYKHLVADTVTSTYRLPSTRLGCTLTVYHHLTIS